MNVLEQSEMYQAFLKEVRAHPLDNAPKLILADWLEEQGHDKAAGNIRQMWADYAGKPVPRWTFLVHPWDFTVTRSSFLKLREGLRARVGVRRELVTKCQDHADVFRCFKPKAVARFTTVALPTVAGGPFGRLAGSGAFGRWLVGGLVEVRFLHAVGLLPEAQYETHLIVPVARVRRVLFNRDRDLTDGGIYVIEIEWPDPFRELTPAELTAYQDEHDRMFRTP